MALELPHPQSDHGENRQRDKHCRNDWPMARKKHHALALAVVGRRRAARIQLHEHALSRPIAIFEDQQNTLSDPQRPGDGGHGEHRPKDYMQPKRRTQ